MITRLDDLRVSYTPKTVNGPGRTVWLASFPKSGNTWMRAIVTALSTHKALFAVNQLRSGSQPHHVSGALESLGIDARWLQVGEVNQLRDHLVRRVGEIDGEDSVDNAPAEPVLRKTHEIWRPGSPGAEPFPADATRAAILIVRDPRDVACSYAPFFGLDLAGAVDALGRPGNSAAGGSPARLNTAQPWGSWSSHTLSWLSDEVPFPVHVVRYEDLKTDAVGTLEPVFAAIGLPCTRAELVAAVEQVRFDRLQASERERGFREVSPNTQVFFRQGRSGGWREELEADLVTAVEADHAPVMERLGYQTTVPREVRIGVAQVRDSRRRQERTPWWQLPPELGLHVERGTVPLELPAAARPRPWIQVTPDEALVRFAGGAGVWVRGGTDVTVSWQPEPGQESDDPSWLLHGWAVTLASLQRGDLSLHAATVRIGEHVVALAGHRGAGKSTTSMALRQAGHQLLVDDVTLLELRPDSAWMRPYSRNVHLLPDAAEALGMAFDSLPILAGGRTKAAFRAEDPPADAQRLDRIVVLTWSNTATDVGLTEIRGSDRLRCLLAHTRRDGIAPLVLGEQRYFELMTRLAATTSVWVLERPRGDWTMPTVVDLLASSDN